MVNELHYNDLIMVVKRERVPVHHTGYGFDVVVDPFEEEVVETLLMFRVVKGLTGKLYCELIRGEDGDYNQYDTDWVVRNGVVVGNFLDDEFFQDLYDRLEKEMIEND